MAAPAHRREEEPGMAVARPMVTQGVKRGYGQRDESILGPLAAMYVDHKAYTNAEAEPFPDYGPSVSDKR
jgi:hypothetical protein